MFNYKNFRIFIFLILTIIISISLLSKAEVPELHSIEGYIFESDGITQVPSGTTVRINATQTNSFKEITTSGPPGYSGFYSTTINALDNELTTVISFNSTHYGKSSTNLLSSLDTTYLNITINLSRSEPNVTILTPTNNTWYTIGDKFIVNSSSSIIGILNGENCNSTISFSNQNIINISTGENLTKQIGTILLGEIKYVSWNISTNSVGKSNITVTTICSSDIEYIDKKNKFTVYNIEIQSEPLPPLHFIEGYIFESDGITQVPSGTTVRINATQTNSFKEITTSGPPGYSGFYSTTINALDNELVIVTSFNETKEGISSTNLLPPPSVTNINVTLNITKILLSVENVSIDNNAVTINLIADSTKLVICNATIKNNQENSHVTSISSVFYDSSATTYNSPDDNNNHYSLNCSYINSSTSLYYASCNFSIWYYANNNSQDSWTCNITTENNLNTNASGIDTTNIEPLLALDVPTTINYGTVDANTVSQENTTTISNKGNIAIDVSIEGYAYSTGDNLSMNCTLGSNITINNEKYNFTSSNSNFYTEKTALTSSPVTIDINIPQRQNDLTDDTLTDVYWQLFVPKGAGGTCIGNIIFGLIQS